MCLSLPGKAKQRRHRGRYDFDRRAYSADSNLLGSMPLARPKNAPEAYSSIIAFAHTAATNSWRKRQVPPWISPSTRRLIASRHLLRSNPADALAYSIACKASRAAICNDIRRRKEKQAKDAAMMGRSIVRATRDLHATKKRLLVPDSVSGALSQQATKTEVQRFYEALYTPAVSLPLAIPLSAEPFPPFLADECCDALAHLKRGHSPGSDRVLPDMLNLSQYADDVALIAKNRLEMEKMLRKLVEACSRVGLEVNASKTVLLTKTLLLTEDANNRQPISINNLQFEYKDGGKYLGRWISLPLENPKEIKRRIQAGWNAWSKIS
ncbi:hypothetical protein PMAYCL1PPCAC_24929 [Pristionchus mayeri]|uniref:Reverse transcriptase domain-containing protein n=1 Tax=Pristionchus mayeri TaxID=1317129 RepID=A0AAN5I7W3_9BILA|nr:hypothetical protein PMAYCL1PPCAC_24929 [Pristionchus mayeri]